GSAIDRTPSEAGRGGRATMPPPNSAPAAPPQACSRSPPGPPRTKPRPNRCAAARPPDSRGGRRPSLTRNTRPGAGKDIIRYGWLKKLQRRINRLTLEREHAEDALVNSP